MDCFFSPAKINLFLRILAKRPDGYHSLATLMQAISLGDFLYIRKSSSLCDQLTCTDPCLPCDGSNLALRAAALFRAKTEIPLYVTMHLDKRIPIEAGLGGGSSNAATVLWAMNQLAGAPCASSTLQEWGGLLGSDVPFFFATGTAYCTGRGEIVRPLPSISLPSLWIVKPPQGLSARAVYAALKLDTLLARNPDMPDTTLAAFGSTQSRFLLYNDLEDAALQLDPTLALLYRALRAQYKNQVLLSGSGSSFFCLGENLVEDLGENLGEERRPHIPQELGLLPCRIEHASSLQRDVDSWYSSIQNINRYPNAQK